LLKGFLAKKILFKTIFPHFYDAKMIL